MALFGSASLVDSVDELIDLVQNWNAVHCKTPHKSKSKKRGHPGSISMAATPAKKSKLNGTDAKPTRNCLFDLETEARTKLVELTTEAIKTIYDLELEEKQQQEWLYSGLARPSHGRGEVTLPCFRLSKPLKSKPNLIAEKIVEEISKAIKSNTGVLFLSNPFLKVEAANGRINAYLTAAYLGQIIPKVLDKNDSFLSPLPSNGEKVMVEYSQPNTHKAFHVGHMRNVALGDCLVRLTTHCGYKTVAANYFGDEGAHVAKCVWWLKKQMDQGTLDLDKVEKECPNKGEWLGTMYSAATTKLSLSSYTKFPYVGVVVAKVVSKGPHPMAGDAAKKIPANWNVVEVEYTLNGEKDKVLKSTVICGGTHYKVGNLVAYIPVGERYKDKIAVKKDMKGVVSEGVIMGALECGVKLPPLPQPESEQKEEAKEEEKEDGGKKSKKSKKKKKQKKKTVKDMRIYLVDEFHPNAKVGDKLTEIGRLDPNEDDMLKADKLFMAGKDVVELWKEYVTEQQNVLKAIEGGDEELVALWMRTRKWSLDEFHKIYKWVGARFDHDFFESECSEDSRKLVDEYYAKGVFVKSEGAIGCQLDDKLGFCLLLKSNGSGLYATKDLSLARKKFEQFNIDRSIYVVDATQSHHFQQVFATLKAMGYQQAEKCYHLPYGFVKLPQGKMASRAGNVILFSELVKLLAVEINEQVLDPIRARNEKADTAEEEKWSEEELKEAERAVSAGVIRYGMLNHDNNKEIVFDLKKWSLASGNTGTYLMYQYARISSIKRKVEYPKHIKVQDLDFSVLEDNATAKSLLFDISHFQQKVLTVCEDKSPSQLCDYLYSICQQYSKWYCDKDNNIMNCKDDHLKAVRLLFCESVAETIKTGIMLLGITPLRRM